MIMLIIIDFFTDHNDNGYIKDERILCFDYGGFCRLAYKMISSLY